MPGLEGLRNAVLRTRPSEIDLRKAHVGQAWHSNSLIVGEFVRVRVLGIGSVLV